MKKFILILIVVAFATNFSNAQNEKFFRFGLYGETGYAWLKPNTKNLESQGGSMSLGYGMIGEFTLADNYSLSTGISIAYDGGKLQYGDMYFLASTANDPTPDSTIYTITRSYKLQYFEIPLCLKMETNEIGYITYWAKFGPGIGFNLKALGDDNVKNTAGVEQPSEDDIDIKKEINFLRASLIIGAGIEYSLGGNTSVIAGVNFNNGLLDILVFYFR